MKLLKGQFIYPMPPFSYIELAVVFTGGDPRLDPHSVAVALPEVGVEAIMDRIAQTKGDTGEFGRPKCCSFNRATGQVLFFPKPDRDYDAQIRFAGPIQEI